MARFYSLIANGGKLVTPHVALCVDEPGQRPPTTSTRPRRKPSDVDPAALAVVRDGPLPRDARSYGTGDGGLRQLPDPDRRQDGHGREGRSAARLRAAAAPGPVLVVRLRAADATEKPKIAVCAVIENGGHGGTAAAPAALKVFEQFFHAQATSGLGPIHSD